MSVVYNKIWDGKRGQCYETKHVKKFPKVKILMMVPKWEKMTQKMHLWIFADSYWFRQGNISTDVNIHETSVRSGRVQKTSMRGGTLGRWFPAARIVEELLSQTWCLLHPTLNKMWVCQPFDSSKMTGEGGEMAWCSWRSECWRSNVSEVISCEIMRNVPQNILMSLCKFTCLRSLKQYFSSKSDRY